MQQQRRFLTHAHIALHGGIGGSLTQQRFAHCLRAPHRLPRALCHAPRASYRTR